MPDGIGKRISRSPLSPALPYPLTGDKWTGMEQRVPTPPDPCSEGGSLTRALCVNSGFILVRPHLTQRVPLVRTKPLGIGSVLILRLSTFA